MGANDGLHMSNSYFFSKTLGWRALLVEGNPDVYARIAKHRPEAERVNALVGNPKPLPARRPARPSSPFTGRATPRSTTPRSTGRRG